MKLSFKWIALCLAGAWLQPSLADQADAEEAVVHIYKHNRKSKVMGSQSKHSNRFYGIRYAEPPVGRRRFQRPVRQYMAGDVLATRVCKPCPQLHPSDKNAVVGDEDCLCINVFTPKMQVANGSAVVVFIHGGNLKSGNSAYFGGAHFTEMGTILVTIQYRLGTLGFLSTGKKEASGNTGFFDMHMAMTWVWDYIEFFGGDPKRITLMGQGSGGSAASLLALAEDCMRIQVVVALSGGPLSPGAVRGMDDPKEHADRLAVLTGCAAEPAEKLVGCLRNMSVTEIILADSKIPYTSIDTVQFLDDIAGRTGAGARVEGPADKRALPPLISYQPADSLNNNRHGRCPLLCGVNSAETAKAVYGKYSKMLTEKLKEERDFVQNVLIGDLQKILDGVKGLVLQGQTDLHDEKRRYYQFANDSAVDVAGGLAKIAEATADALFNLPAYQSVKAWGSPAYLYSFEHLGNLTRGSHFLPGVDLAGSSEESNALYDGARPTATAHGPSHGDELAYLFEALDEAGNPIPEEISSADKRVRENFHNLFAHIARQSFGENSTIDSVFPVLKSKEQFFKIGQEITKGMNFKFCQMGMWGSLNDRVLGKSCQNFLNKLPMLDITPIVNEPKIPSSGSTEKTWVNLTIDVIVSNKSFHETKHIN